MQKARVEIWQALLKNQIFLSKHANISVVDSDSLTYNEFTKLVALLAEYMKEIGPQMGDMQ